MAFGIPEKWHLILASRSPRRQQLLKELGFTFDVIFKDYHEKFPQHLSGKEIAEYLSRFKALQFRGEIADCDIVITADTIVWCNNQVLDKPTDYNDAFRILRNLSGKTHEVITGITLYSNHSERTFSQTTTVSFDHLRDEDIDYYIKEYKPYDKAGAYGIQEWIGLKGIISIEGSYFNVMGMPVQLLYTELEKFVINLENR